MTLGVTQMKIVFQTTHIPEDFDNPGEQVFLHHFSTIKTNYAKWCLYSIGNTRNQLRGSDPCQNFLKTRVTLVAIVPIHAIMIWLTLITQQCSSHENV